MLLLFDGNGSGAFHFSSREVLCATIRELPDSSSRPVLESRESNLLTQVIAGLKQLRERLETAQVKWPFFLAALACAVFIYLLLTRMAASRQLWHDELFTYYIAKTPTFSEFWKALGLDLNPPLSYLAVRASMALFGDSSYAVRLPSIAAFLSGSLCLCWFIARRLRPVYGLLAMLVLWSTPFLYYATEARPYGMILGFFGIAMLAWQRATEPGRKTLTVLTLSLAVAALMLSHLLAVFYVAILCFAELLRSLRLRKLDWTIWAALLLPYSIPFAFLRIVSGYQQGAVTYLWRASFRKILPFYESSLSPEAPVLLLIITIAFFAGSMRQRPEVERDSSLRLPELGLVIGLLALPAVLNLALMRVQGGFFDRYSVPTAYAYALLLVFLIAKFTDRSRLAALFSCCILFVYLCDSNGLVDTAIDKLRGRTTETESAQFASIEGMHPELPLVAASGLTFLEMDKYTSPKTVSRLYYLTDHDLALSYAHATIFEGFGILKKHFPIRANVEPYREFVVRNRHFLVLGTAGYTEDWLIPELLHIRATLNYLGDIPGPYKDHELYDVKMPE